jgi:hypothetical protein
MSDVREFGKMVLFVASIPFLVACVGVAVIAIPMLAMALLLVGPAAVVIGIEIGGLFGWFIAAVGMGVFVIVLFTTGDGIE